MNALLRWLAFLILTICCAVAWNGARSWILAILMAVALLTLFASFGAFRRDVWFGTPEQDAEYARIDAEIDAEIRAHETWREERLRRVIT